MNTHQRETPERTGGKWWRILLVAALLAVAFSFTALSRPSVAHAHTGGQQIELVHCPPLQAVQVEGFNQDWQWASWTGWGYGATSILVKDWWWQSDITILYTTTDGRQYYQAAWVPTNQIGSDITYIPFDALPYPSP